MCLKTTQVVIEIIVALYLTGVCRCLYIPSKSNDLIHNLMDTGKGEKSIQICGNHLTNLLVQICDGNFNEMSAGKRSMNEICSMFEKKKKISIIPKLIPKTSLHFTSLHLHQAQTNSGIEILLIIVHLPT